MRKGQAATEFLMTYSWAILVVLIAIGILAYFGIFNPYNFLPEQSEYLNEFNLNPLNMSCEHLIALYPKLGSGRREAMQVMQLKGCELE